MRMMIKWSWSPLTDPASATLPPLFSKDGRFFFAIVGAAIKIHTAASGHIVSTLPASHDDAHTDDITAAVLSPQNPYQLITASLDGTLKFWDFLDAVLLRTIVLGQPIRYLCAHHSIRDHLFVAAHKTPDDTDKGCVILRVSLKTQKTLFVGKTRTTTGLAVSASGERLIAIAGRKAYVAHIANLKAGFIKFVSPEQLTCLAAHPSEDYFATGDVKGIVRLWYCLDPKLVKVVGVEKKSQTSTFHWHAHAVASVAFTANGAYLLSGGEESVLVIWQLHSGKREFVPRVGAPIKNIVVSPSRAAEEEYLLGLADASHAFVSSATLELSRVFARIKLDPIVSTLSTFRPSLSSTPLAVHHLSKTLILPSSHPSSLQTYAPSQFSLVAELEVSPSNRVSRREDKALEPSRVERAVLSSTGEWMATIDRREGDESFRSEIYLKLWFWDKKTAFWILNTRIDRPHGLAKLTSLSFRPGHDGQLVTAGEDGNVKAWRIRRTQDQKGREEVSWMSRSTFSFRSDIPRHTSWSHDGSLLAVPMGSSIVLYDPDTYTVVQSFVMQECRRPLEAHFIGQSGRYLAVMGGQDLALWDVLAQSVVWHHKNQYRYCMLLSHPHHDTFITIHSTSPDLTSSSVTLFSAGSGSPTPLLECELPFGILNLAWFSPFHTSAHFSLVAVTHKYGVMVMGDNVVLPDDPGASAKAIQNLPAAPRRSLFEEMFGVPAIVNLDKQTREPATDPLVPWRSSDTAGFFDAPSHLMPPIETFFDPLIDSFLSLRTTDDGDAIVAQPEDGEDDIPADQEETEPVVPSTVVSDEAVLDEFVPLFREMAAQACQTVPAHPSLPSKPVTNGLFEKNAAGKPISRILTKNSVHSDVQIPGRKPNRVYLG